MKAMITNSSAKRKKLLQFPYFYGNWEMGYLLDCLTQPSISKPSQLSIVSYRILKEKDDAHMYFPFFHN